jgi:putative toxin-antitoxin system antitoxin component (TIGR02293 family)
VVKLPKMANSKKNKTGPYVVNEAAVAYQLTSEGPTFKTFLGGKSTSFQEVTSKHQFISIIKGGIEKKSLDYLMEKTGLTSEEMASIIHTSERTLRRYTDDTKLNPEQSERIIELARLYARGSEVFGSLPAFNNWINKSILALGGKMPKSFFDTSMGIEIIMEELGRIEHGIFA